MENGQRKATDILLELESKLNLILEISKNQDLNLKLLSNKINILSSKIDDNIKSAIKIDNVGTDAIESQINNAFLSTPYDLSLKVDDSPSDGFRRTSRPETFSKNNKSAQTLQKNVVINENVQDIIFQSPKNEKVEKETSQSFGAIPVVQRIVDKNSKSVFLADVEVKSSSGEIVIKTRTNGTGKWVGSLNPGTYKVMVKKRESISKQQLECVKEIKISESKDTLILEDIVLK